MISNNLLVLLKTQLNPLAPQDCGISINTFLVNYLGGFDYDYNNDNNPNFLDFIFNTPLPNKSVPPVVPAALATENNQYIYLPKYFNASGQPYLYDDPAGVSDDHLWYRFTQQNYLLPQWNCLSKIIIYTQSLPVRNQQTTSRNINSPDVLDKYPILFSFTPIYETSSQARNYIYYTARENYTLTELLSSQPLTKIDAYIAWVDHNGEVYPIYLNPFQSCNLQLGFFKKELYKSIK